MSFSERTIELAKAKAIDFEIRFYSTTTKMSWNSDNSPDFSGVFDIRKYKIFNGFASVRSIEPPEKPFVAFEPMLKLYDGTDGDGLPDGWSSSGRDVTPESGWQEITDRVKDFTITHSLDGHLATWQVDLSGSGYDPNYIDRDRGCIAVWRARHVSEAGEWLDWNIWNVLFFGWFVRGTDVEQSTEDGQWRFVVKGISYLLGLYQVVPHSWGLANVARGKNVTVSSVIGAPETEAGRGEFTGSTAIVEASKIVDGVVYGTPWIANDAPVKLHNVTVVGTIHHPWVIGEVYARPPLGYPGQVYQWFELMNVHPTLPFDLGEGVPSQLQKFWNSRGQMFSLHNYGRFRVEPNGGTVIFCYDRARFQEIFGGLGASSTIVEWKGLNRDWYLNPDEDVLVIRIWDKMDQVRWSANPSYNPSNPDPGESRIFEWVWSGGPVDSSPWTPGSSIERYRLHDGVYEHGYDSDTASDWHVQPYPSPGRLRLPDRLQYASVNLSDIGVSLDGDHDAYCTTLVVNKTVGMTSHGRGIVNGHVFNYTGKTATTLTGVTWVYGSFAMGDGSPVYQYWNNVTQRGWRLGRADLWRRPGLAHIKEGRVFVSNLANLSGDDYPNPDSPEETLWINSGQWRQVRDISGVPDSNGCIRCDLGGEGMPFYARHFMVVIDQMQDSPHTGQPDLAKLNEIEIYPDPAVVDSVSGEGTTDVVNHIREILLGEFKLPESKFKWSIWGTLAGNQSTAGGTMLELLEDLGRMYGGIVVEMYDGSLEWRPNPWWDTNSRYAMYWHDWDRDSLSMVEVTSQDAHAVGQVKVIATDPLRRAVWSVAWPPFKVGGTVQAETDIVTSSAEKAISIARALYTERNNRVTISARITGIAHWIMPGQLHNLEWIVGERVIGEPISSKDFEGIPRWEVTGVEHTVSMGDRTVGKSWYTTATMLRYRL